jgi:redox-sensitive bicupin YhaK (pirin superfamily)
VSNLETDPVEVVAECLADEASPVSRVEILSPRLVPLGGPRAMTVRRTLPQRQRSTIGGWCFIDHYGPQDVSETGGMRVPPHPHTGLQTVSWLFAGEIEHRDSVGSHALVRPGELNLMTAGRGISHSEVSTPATTVLHGVQLWVALPKADRAVAPFFEHRAPPALRREGVELRVFVGALAGAFTDASVFSPLVGAQIDLTPGATLELALDPSFEHGVLVDLGPVRINDTDVAPAELAYLAPANGPLTLAADVSPARVILLGGEPLGEEIVMWWNFIGASHDDIVAFRSEWQDDVIGGQNAHGRFGSIPEYDGPALPAPVLPTVRLKPRG